MLGLFKRPHKTVQVQAKALYETVVRQARQPKFYRDMNVPDTLDGRYEMISLHTALVLYSLQRFATQESSELAQGLFDEMFFDMDRSLREMGVGDLSVPKKMKVMMNGFNGRLKAYHAALKGEEKLQDVIRRNVYGTVKEGDIKGEAIARLSDYTRHQYVHLQNLPEQRFFSDAKDLFKMEE